MRIGIMTWYRYENYGTVLQACALSKKIEQLGYDPRFIQYTPKGKCIVEEKFDWKYITHKIKNKIINRNNRLYVSEERHKLFKKYIELHIVETRLCNTYPELFELNEEYDAFVCGSDQIWSPLCFDDKYFLSFVKNSEKMVAYAPSIGTVEVTNSYIREEMSQQLKRFKYLSVREKQGAELIYNIAGVDAKVVLDPTLLLTAEEWKVYGVKDRATILKSNYIVCYFLGEYRKYETFVKTLSKKSGMSVYVVPVFDGQEKYAAPFEVGPSEFITLIKNAKYVCTDSFHGMAFSINFNIPFSVFKRFSDGDPENQNSRIINLLEVLKLSDRLIESTSNALSKNFFECDFEYANRKLEKLRDDSIEFLKKTLAQATKSRDDKKEYNEDYKITDLCCGCGSCASICPTGAITIGEDSEGFQHYNINCDSCVNCGLCKKVCPFVKIIAGTMNNAISLCSVKSKDSQILKHSSSGGIGYEIARFCNRNEMYVSGSMYNTQKNCAEHILIKPYHEKELSLIQGSKYIQSVSEKVFKEICQLEKGKQLAFFGTPCQVAGIDKVLRVMGRRNDAVLVDLICHGVPSLFLWRKYIKAIKLKYRIGEHPKVSFRNPHGEWRNRTMVLNGNGCKYKKSEKKDDFYAFFRRNLCYMKTCYECPYREKTAADIRIGDYWGERYLNDKTGVSMVIINTEKGRYLLNELEQTGRINIDYHELLEYWTVQHPYNSKIPAFREQLINELKTADVSLTDLRKKYCTSYDIWEAFNDIKMKIKSYKSFIRKEN